MKHDMSVICLIPVDLQRTRFDLPSHVGDRLVSATVLQHTVVRAARIPQIERIVIVHPDGQAPLSLIDPVAIDKPVNTFVDPDQRIDAHTPRWVAARKWAMECWRGGLGSATCHDELLPAGPLAAAMEKHGANSAYLIGGDWCLFDPALAEAQLKVHLDAPEAMKLVFTQAPPGLAGLAVTRDVLQQLRDTGSGFGGILGYNPFQPAIDPIGRDVCIAVSPVVRDLGRRFIYDTPRTIQHIRAISHGVDPLRADSDQIARASVECESLNDEVRLPTWVTLELTTRRPLNGSITPQHYAAFDRPDIDPDLAGRIFDQLEPDTAVTLGGLGDALEHPHLHDIIRAAHTTGMMGIGIETDLLCDTDDAIALLDLPLDVISIRFNADTSETYRRVNGVDGFSTVARNLKVLIDERSKRSMVVPWLAPRLIKTPDTLTDLESFFERWKRVAGCQPVIESNGCGCGLMPDVSPVPMTPPMREPCRQLGRRMTILSDGVVALCDQDWMGTSPLGDAKTHGLSEIYRNHARIADHHRSGVYTSLTLCGSCDQWHRP